MEGDIGEDRVAQNHLLSCIAHGPVGLPNADEMAERAGQPVTRRQITFLHSSLPLHIRETHQTCQWGGNPSGAIVLSSHVAGWETLSKIIFWLKIGVGLSRSSNPAQPTGLGCPTNRTGALVSRAVLNDPAASHNTAASPNILHPPVRSLLCIWIVAVRLRCSSSTQVALPRRLVEPSSRYALPITRVSTLHKLRQCGQYYRLCTRPECTSPRIRASTMGARQRSST